MILRGQSLVGAVAMVMVGAGCEAWRKAPVRYAAAPSTSSSALATQIPWFTPGTSERPPLIVLNGLTIADSLVERTLKAIPLDGVASIEILRGEDAIARFGARAKDGAFVITTKKR